MQRVWMKGWIEDGGWEDVNKGWDEVILVMIVRKWSEKDAEGMRKEGENNNRR